MTDAELLDNVKSGLSITGTLYDFNLMQKIAAVKGYMLNAGISIQQIVSDLGIACLTIGVNDIWNLSSGEVKFSAAFNMILTQLEVVSLPDV